MAAMSAQLYLKLYQRYPIMRGHLQGISKSSLKYNLGLKLSKQNLIPEANSFVTLRGLGVRGRGKRENCCEGEQKSALWGSEETTFKELTIPNIEENMCVDSNLTDNFPFESQFLLKFTLSVKCLPFKWNRVLIFEGLLFTVSTNFVHNYLIVCKLHLLNKPISGLWAESQIQFSHFPLFWRAPAWGWSIWFIQEFWSRSSCWTSVDN